MLTKHYPFLQGRAVSASVGVLLSSARISENDMGGKAMAAAPPAYSLAKTQHDMWVEAWSRRLNELVSDDYYVRVEMMRDLALDSYRVVVRVMKSDWTFHGELNEVVHDLHSFPSDTLRTQLIMLAG